MSLKEIEVRLDADNSKQYVKLDGEQQSGIIGIHISGSGDTIPRLDLQYDANIVVKGMAEVSATLDTTDISVLGICYQQAQQQIHTSFRDGELSPEMDDVEFDGLIMQRALELYLEHAK